VSATGRRRRFRLLDGEEKKKKKKTKNGAANVDATDGDGARPRTGPACRRDAQRAGEASAAKRRSVGRGAGKSTLLAYLGHACRGAGPAAEVGGSGALVVPSGLLREAPVTVAAL
jgi:hypothetical protein